MLICQMIFQIAFAIECHITYSYIIVSLLNWNYFVFRKLRQVSTFFKFIFFRYWIKNVSRIEKCFALTAAYPPNNNGVPCKTRWVNMLFVLFNHPKIYHQFRTSLCMNWLVFVHVLFILHMFILYIYNMELSRI